MPSLCVKQDKVIAADAAETTLKQCLTVVEKKVRNLEKRKTKLDSYKQTEFAELNKDQKDAIAKYEVVMQNLDFARDLQKQFQTMLAESEKMFKKQAKREKIERQQQEISRLRMLLRLNGIVAGLSKENVKSDFLTGKRGAVILSEERVEQLQALGTLIRPCDDLSDDGRLDEASEHIASFLDAKESPVVGTTYKDLLETVESIVSCGYFCAPTAELTNGHSEVRETDLKVCLNSPSKNGDAAAETHLQASSVSPSTLSTNSDDLSMPPVDGLSSLTISNGTDQVIKSSSSLVFQSSSEVSDEVLAETVNTASNKKTVEPHRNGYSSPFLFETPAVQSCDELFAQKKDAQEIVSALQGSFNFLQESEVDEKPYNIDFTDELDDPSSTEQQTYDASVTYANNYMVPISSVTSSQQHFIPASDQSHSAFVTYASQYAAPQTLTTMPYVVPLVTDPYLVHQGLGYPHQPVYTTTYGTMMPGFTQQESVISMCGMNSYGEPIESSMPAESYVDGHAEYESNEVYDPANGFAMVDQNVAADGIEPEMYETITEQHEKKQLNPNANEFRMRYSPALSTTPCGTPTDEIVAQEVADIEYRGEEVLEDGGRFHGARGRGWHSRGGPGYYHNHRGGFNQRYRNHPNGFSNGGDYNRGAWHPVRRGGRGRGMRGNRGYARNGYQGHESSAETCDASNEVVN